MYYFYNNGKTIFKQEITFYKDDVNKLRKEVINKCSFITHKEYDSDYEPNIDERYIRNFTRKFVGYKEYFEEYRRIYHYSFDQLNIPYLVSLIDRLLKNDSTVIYEIDHYDYTSEYNIDNEIKQKQLECELCNNKNYSKKIELLKELERLMKTKKLNRNQLSTKDYYYNLLSYIQRKNICELDKKVLDKVSSFIDINISIKDGIVIPQQNDIKQYTKK